MTHTNTPNTPNNNARVYGNANINPALVNNNVVGQVVPPNYNGVNYAANPSAPQCGAYCDPFTGTMQNAQTAPNNPNAPSDLAYQTFIAPAISAIKQVLQQPPNGVQNAQPNVQPQLQNISNMNAPITPEEIEALRPKDYPQGLNGTGEMNRRSATKEEKNKQIEAENERMDKFLSVSSNNEFAPTPIGGGYGQNGQGIYYPDENGNMQRVTDFAILKAEKHRCYEHDEVFQEYYVFTFRNNNGKYISVSVKTNQIRKLAQELEKQAPDFLIFQDVCSGALHKFDRAVREFLKERMRWDLVETKVFYKCWGWGPLEAGKRKFFDGTMMGCDSEKKLMPHNPSNAYQREAMQKAVSIFQVGNATTVYPLIIYSLAVYADALFTDAGYPLQCSMMAVGQSGYLKTSFVRVIFNPFVPEKDRLATVRSTSAAMNVLYQLNYDDTTVIDDWNFEGNEREVEEKKKVIREAIRTFSDKSPRAKWAGDGKVAKSSVRGGLVFTGEANMTGQIASSELRYIKVPFDEPIDGSKLQKFQQNGYIWKQLVSEWIFFLQTDYKNIVAHITNVFPQLRMETKIKESRLTDAYIHLYLTCDLFASFLQRNNLMTAEVRNEFVSSFSNIVLRLIERQSIEATNQISYIGYLRELWNLMGTGKIKVADNLDVYLRGMRRYVGYKDNNIIMLKRDETYEAVHNAYLARNEFFASSADEVSKMLKNHGLTITENGENLKKASARIAGRPRMLALIEPNCLAVLDSLKE